MELAAEQEDKKRQFEAQEQQRQFELRKLELQ